MIVLVLKVIEVFETDVDVVVIVMIWSVKVMMER